MSVGILITARLKSVRLPRKVLREIQGRPLLSHLIDRMKRSRRASKIVLCTSHLAEDAPLVELAEREGILSFRGHPDDVLLRLTDAAAFHGIETVLNCTADNPFVSAEFLDRLAEFHVSGAYDYSETRGLPLGAFSWALSRAAMHRACDMKDSVDTEIWGGYFVETGVFRTGVLEILDPAVRRPDLRITVDTPEDFEVARAIFQALGRDGRAFGLREIVGFCDKNPAVTALNSAVVQRTAPPIRLRPGADGGIGNDEGGGR